MSQQKPHSFRRYGICLVVLCLCGCLFLSIGATFARYRTEYQVEAYKFEAYAPQSYLLHGEVTTQEQIDAIDQGTWPEYPNNWTMYTPETAPFVYLVVGAPGEDDVVLRPDAQLRFSVSNGLTDEQYTQRDQLISLQLVAPLTVEDPTKLTVVLSGPDLLEPEKEVQYLAVPEAIEEGSFLYETYGYGWVYRFYEEDEVTQAAFPLSGDGLEYTNFAISIKGTIPLSLLSLEITGKYQK